MKPPAHFSPQLLLNMLADDLRGDIGVIDFSVYVGAMTSAATGLEPQAAATIIQKYFARTGRPAKDDAGNVLVYDPNMLLAHVLDCGPAAIRRVLLDPEVIEVKRQIAAGEQPMVLPSPSSPRVSINDKRALQLMRLARENPQWLELTGDKIAGRWESRLSSAELIGTLIERIPDWNDLDATTIAPAVRRVFKGTHGLSGRSKG